MQAWNAPSALVLPWVGGVFLRLPTLIPSRYQVNLVDQRQQPAYDCTMTPTQIKAMRDRLQMTQDEFARLLGLDHRASVSRLESGTREATGVLLAFLRHLSNCQRGK